MKQLTGFTAVMLLAIGAMAQSGSANRAAIVVKGGVNFANISVTDNGRIDKSNTLTRFHVGFGGDLPLAEGLSLQPSLLLSGKGAKSRFNESTDATYWEATTKPLYVELPMNLVGKIPLTNAFRLYIGAGPYVAAGIGGKNKVAGKVLGNSFSDENKIDFSSDDPSTSVEEGAGYGKLKRFDYGLNAVAGLEFTRFTIGANYGYGLAKINSNTDNTIDDKGKHRLWALSLGFKL